MCVFSWKLILAIELDRASQEAEWHNYYQLHSGGVKHLTIVYGFRPETENFDLANNNAIRKGIPRGYRFQLCSTFQCGDNV